MITIEITALLVILWLGTCWLAACWREGDRVMAGSFAAFLLVASGYAASQAFW